MFTGSELSDHLARRSAEYFFAIMLFIFALLLAGLFYVTSEVRAKQLRPKVFTHYASDGTVIGKWTGVGNFSSNRAEFVESETGKTITITGTVRAEEAE